MRINKYKKRKKGTFITLLILLSFIFAPILSFADLVSATIQEENITPVEGYLINVGKNYWYQGTFYDDADPTFAWTTAEIQFVYDPTSYNPLTYNYSIIDFDNNEIQYGDPNNISMIKGTTDSTDNMKVNDSSYTTFTSTHTDGYIYETPSQWDNFTFTEGTGGVIGELESIDANYSTLISTECIIVNDEFINSVTYTTGSPGAEPLSNSYTDDTDYYQMNSELDYGNHWITVEFVFDPALAGRDFLISAHITTSGDASVNLKINDVSWKTGLEIDFYDEPKTGVTSIKFTTWSEATSHNSKVYYFKIVEDATPVSAELDVQVDIQVDNPILSSIEYFKYSHKTNISVDVDLDIWNWDTSTWYEIESVNNIATFDDDSFTLGVDSDYVNSSFGVRMRFQATSSSGDFEIQIDRLRLDYFTTTPPAELEMTITFPFVRYNEDLLVMNVSSWQKTNISQFIVFQIWNYTGGNYEQISNSSDTTFTNKKWNSTSQNDYISSSGLVKLYWYGLNTTYDFELHIDYLYTQIYYKTIIKYQKSLDLIGIWKYRFVLDEGLGSEHITSYIYINVVQFDPNVELISESPYYTEWELLYTSETTATTTIYNEDFTSDMWSIEVSNDAIVFNSTVSDDAYVWDDFPNNNFGSSTDLYVEDWVDVRETYLKKEFPDIQNYLLLNTTQNSTLRIYETDAYASFMDIDVYTTSDFDEDIITWNNKLSMIDYISTLSSEVYNWNTFDLGNGLGSYFVLVGGEIPTGYVWYYSKETEYDPTIAHYISKFYQDTSNGYTYIQTDESETLKLNSPSINLDLFAGAKIKIIFNTTSTNKIDLNLLNSGIEQKSFEVVSQGNSNFDDQILILNVDGNYSGDQLQFEGIFDDTKNLFIKDITIYQYNATETGDIIRKYVDPDGYKQIFLEYPYEYTCNIYEQNLLVDSINFTSSYDMQTFIYEVAKGKECYITFYDSNNEYLDFNLFTTYANYTYDGNSIINERLSDNILLVDDDTLISFNIYDSFIVLVKSYQIYEEIFIDIILDIYTLKIKNQASEYVSYILQKGNVRKNGNIFSGEIVDYYISTGNYTLNYTNHEDDSIHLYSFNLQQNKIITINTTYSVIYFSMFTYDGLGVDPDLVRFYINDERKDFGFNIIQSDTGHLLILDFFNNTLANETIDARIYSEYNLFVEIYSLIILNQFTYEDIIVNITQVGSGVWMTQIIPKQFGLTYRFLPNVEYNITIYFTNATLYTSRIVNLTTNSHIESFGVPTTTPEYPKEVYFGVYTTTGLGINHDLLRFYIDNVRTDFGFNRIENMIITITVKDYFNTTLFNQAINTSGIYEYNILITLFSLKIKNEARVYSNYTLKLGVLETTGFILPEEIIEYQLASNNYVFEFTNNEDDSFHTININLNENKVYIINSTYYTAYFGLFDQYNHRLDNSLFSLYLNGTRKDFGFIELSSEYYNITVYDWLNISVFNQIIYLFDYTEYNIYITVFELQIRHLAQENSNFSLCETTSGNYINFSMAPDTLTSYMLSSSTYNITWINGENMQTSYYYITLDSNYILTLSSTYRGVYFALFTYDGLGINHDLVKFYINESRKDFGFNMMSSALAEIVVLDFFNTTLFNQTIDFSSLSEYNIFIEIYSLIILNQFTYEDIITNITQVGSGIWLNHIIPKQFALSCRFAPNMNYTINVYYVNNSLYTTRTINLTENNHIESFGTPTLPSEYPKDIYFSVYTGTGLAIDQLLLKFYIDGDRADFGFNTIGSVMVSIVVKDFFNTTLFNQNVNTSGIYEYDILITIYSLKIKNEALRIVNYTLNLGTLTDTGNILPDEIIEYQLSTNSYIFEYTNQEDNSFGSISFTLDEDKVYILNSTYYDIYFSLYDVNLHTFYSTQYEFRLNNTIQDLGLVVDLQSDNYNITIKDRFGTYLFNSIITLRGLNEYRVDITLYEIQIRHLARENSNLTLTEDISGNTYSFIMMPYSSKSIIVGSADYSLSWTNGENGITTSIPIALTTDRVIMLNTSYYNIRFSLFDVNLHTINPYQYVFRLNGTILDLGLIVDLQSDDYAITVVDRFGTYLFNNIVNLRGLNEYRIDIILYELQISHQARENSDLILTEDITSNTYSFIMMPYSSKSIIVGSADYTLSWTNGENGITTLITIALIEDIVVMLNTSYYDIFFSLYDVNLHDFNPYQYEFRLNGTIHDFGFIVDLQSDDYTIIVTDRFGVSLFNSIITLRGLNEYRIDITLYEIQIRHLARENSNLTLIEDISNNTYSFIMTPDSIKSILMGSSNYTLNWTNGENNQLTMFSINLTSDAVIKLNTTYYDIHFGLFNFDGLGLEPYLFRFYINNERKDFGFNEMQIDTNRLTVKDYFGAILFDSVINTRQYTEYNIYVEVWALILHNNYSHAIYIEIERNDNEIRQIIPAHASIQYRFLPNIRYEIRVYDTDNNKLDEETVKLDENNKIVSFGFYSTYVPRDPFPLINSQNMLVWFAIFVIFILFIIIVLYVRFKKEKASIPIELRRFIKQKKKKSNIKKNGYSDKDIYID